MQEAGFVDTGRPNVTSLGLVFAIHAAVLGAIILTPPETFKRIIYDPLVTYNVPLKPPPPMPDPEPRQQADKPVTTPRTIVPTAHIDAPDLRPQEIIPETPPPPSMPEIIPAPQPAPVLVEAKTDPRFASALQPPYPSALARQEIEGKVVIRVLVGVDGRVKAVEPVSATDPAFQEATANQALKRWRFKPATRDGAPVESWRTMTVRFELAS